MYIMVLLRDLVAATQQYMNLMPRNAIENCQWLLGNEAYPSFTLSASAVKFCVVLMHACLVA